MGSLSFDLLLLLGILSFLRRLDGPDILAEVSTTVSGKGRMLSFLRRLDRSDEVSTTVSGKGRFLDEDSTLLDSGKKVEECFFFCLAFALEEKISSISDMVVRELYCHDCVTSDVTTCENGFALRLSNMM